MAFGRVLGLDPSATAVQIARSLFGERGPMVSTRRDRKDIGPGPGPLIEPPKALEGFVVGTRVATPAGLRAIEMLKPGDLVETQDAGAQTVLRVERVHASALRAQAPIRFAAGAHGAEREVLVSPQQRVLVRDPVLELLFGEAEVLVAARSLVDGEMVTRCPGGTVDYVRLVFERSHMILAEGLAAESFRPGPRLGASGTTDSPAAEDDHGSRRMLRNLESQMMRKLVI